MNDKTDSIKVIEPQFSGDYRADNKWLIAQDTAPFMAFWDLDVALAPLFASYPKYVQEEIYQHGKCKWGYSANPSKFEKPEWDVFYIPRKIFVICTNGGENHKFYHLQQFFPDYADPGADVANRCAQELEAALHEMGIWPRKLSSPVAIYEDYFMQHMDLPTFYDVPEKSRGILQYAIQCNREWNEIFQIGAFSEAWDYDLNSAYPMQMVNLMDTRAMQIVESEDYQEKAAYGYALCNLTIDERVKVHPILHADDDGFLSTPTGEWQQVLTKGQIDFIAKYHLGDLDILSGYWMIPTKDLFLYLKSA